MEPTEAAAERAKKLNLKKQYSITSTGERPDQEALVRAVWSIHEHYESIATYFNNEPEDRQASVMRSIIEMHPFENPKDSLLLLLCCHLLHHSEGTALPPVSLPEPALAILQVAAMEEGHRLLESVFGSKKSDE